VVATVVLLLTLVAVLFLVANWDDWTSPLQDEVAEIPSLVAVQQQEEATGSESLLVLVMDRDGRTGGMVLAAAADDHPATVTLIPTLLFELLPGYGYFPVGDAAGFEGPELAQIAVANALGVRIDRVVVVPSRRLSSLSLSLDVKLSEPVIEHGDVTDFQIAEQGIRTYDPGTLEELLTLQFDSSPVSWLERQAAVWRSLLEAMAVDPTLAAQIMGDSPSAATLARVAAGDPEVSFIPVEPVAVAGGDDGFQLVQVDVAAFVVERLQHLALATEERPRVEVLNGNGEILATRAVVEAIVAAGFHVIKTDNAENFEFQETVVISQGRANLDSAEAAASILGVRMVQLEVAAPSGVVDLSIIVGQDIATLRS
jgi:hypothetical protein